MGFLDRLLGRRENQPAAGGPPQTTRPTPSGQASDSDMMRFRVGDAVSFLMFKHVTFASREGSEGRMLLPYGPFLHVLNTYGVNGVVAEVDTNNKRYKVRYFCPATFDERGVGTSDSIPLLIEFDDRSLKRTGDPDPDWVVQSKRR